MNKFLNNKKNDENIFINYKKFQKKIKIVFDIMNNKKYIIKIIKIF